jgi:fluoroacetyl-CoA thioesterase
MQLKPGLLGTATLVVGTEHTAPQFGSGRAPVLATPIMIALMEAAAVDCVERLLDEGQESLGVRIDVEHTAGTPIGLAVTATAELQKVSGRKLAFYVEARDSREVIGKGRHERVVVDAASFRAKVAAKVGAARLNTQPKRTTYRPKKTH